MLSKKINSILSVLYWKDKPAIINEDEIFAIKEFANNHHEIRLEKLLLNLIIDENFMDSISYFRDKKVLKIKNRAFRMNLPSLGFTMVAEMGVENRVSKGIVFNNKELLVQS